MTILLLVRSIRPVAPKVGTALRTLVPVSAPLGSTVTRPALTINVLARMFFNSRAPRPDLVIVLPAAVVPAPLGMPFSQFPGDDQAPEVSSFHDGIVAGTRVKVE